MDDSVEPVAAPASVGATLAAERERQGLSRGDAAQRLHMSLSQIQALEECEYERLPKGPFLRGFVRNYAKTLGLDGEALVARLAEGAPREPAPGIVVPTHNIRFGNEALSNSPYVKAGLLAFVAVLMGFAAMYWWLFVRTAPPALAPKVEAPAPQTIAAPPANDAGKSDPLPLPAEPRTEPAPPEPSKAEGPAAAPSPVIAGRGEGTLRFRFSASSWVEVKDATGKVVYSRTSAAGSESQVVGKLPLSVIIGNAPAVTVLYNDRDFPLGPHTKVAVARFTVETP